MKKLLGVLLIISILMSACASNKPAYKTAKGKKKLKYYNDIQFGGRKARLGY
jgi:thioredoxin-related protein